MNTNSSEKLLFCSLLLELLETKPLHPVDRVALQRHLHELGSMPLEDAPSLNAHPLYRQLFSYEFPDDEKSGLLNQKTLQLLRNHLVKAHLSIEEEALIEAKIPEETLYELFENEVISSEQTNGQDPRRSSKVSADSFLTLLSWTPYSPGFYSKVLSFLQKHSQAMTDSGHWERGAPAIYSEIIKACEYFLVTSKHNDK